MGTIGRSVLAVFLILIVTFVVITVFDSLGDRAVGFIQRATAIGGAIVAIVILGIALSSKRAASRLLVIGAIIVAMEHAGWAIISAGNLLNSDDLLQVAFVEARHARLHFFMAGIFTLIGVVLLVIIAATLLKEGRREGWYSLLFALVFGGAFDLLMGARWYPKGMPLFRVVGLEVTGWGWQWLYLYFLAWAVALVISYRPIFRRHAEPGVASRHAA